MGRDAYLLFASALFLVLWGVPSFLHCGRLLRRGVEALERIALANERFTVGLLGILDILIEPPEKNDVHLSGR